MTEISRHRQPSDGSVPVDITPADAGWQYSGVRVVELAAGERYDVSTGESEYVVLPLAGSVDVEVSGRQPATFELRGRNSVFTDVSDFAYVGRDSAFTLLSTDGAQIALPSARCERALAPAYGSADDVQVEVRGAGAATRQVNNIAIPGQWEHADRLICCELLTPAGNWSSYPPHKHDVSAPCEVVNEEIYLYRIAGADQRTSDRRGVGYHRTYTGPEHDDAGLEPIDDLFEVRDLDVVLVPYGYHGPSIAAASYPMYYLNVMAGPGERAMAVCDDPAHAWIRDSWRSEPVDPRYPMTPARPEPPAARASTPASGSTA